MPGRDLLIAVCVALFIHTGIFFVAPTRSTILPKPVTKKRTIEVSLCETPRPKPPLPQAHKTREAIHNKKVVKPQPKLSTKPSFPKKPKSAPKPQLKQKRVSRKKPGPKPPSRQRTTTKPNPQPKPEFQPVKAPIVPEESTEDKSMSVLHQELQEVGEKAVETDNSQEIDEAVLSAIATLEEREFVVDSRPTVPDTEPSYLHAPKPRYPSVAIRRGIEGIVILKVEVLLDGTVGRVSLKRSSGFTPLDRSAMRAVKKWIFLPATCNGVSLKAWVNVPVRFELGG